MSRLDRAHAEAVLYTVQHMLADIGFDLNIEDLLVRVRRRYKAPRRKLMPGDMTIAELAYEERMAREKAGES